nr:MAG TPA: Ribosomal silencing factor during starvation [Caudoviricetes sp.]
MTQYKIIASCKNHTHLHEAMRKIRGRKIPNG